MATMTDKDADTLEVPRCVNHCGHDPMTYDFEGKCSRFLPDESTATGWGTCGHKCEVPAPASVPQGPELKGCPFCHAIPVKDANHWASIRHAADCWRALITEDRIEHFHERTFAAWDTRPADADRVVELEAEVTKLKALLSIPRVRHALEAEGLWRAMHDQPDIAEAYLQTKQEQSHEQ